MKPWEHYIESEDLLQNLDDYTPDEQDRRIARALVHSNLAQVQLVRAKDIEEAFRAINGEM